MKKQSKHKTLMDFCKRAIEIYGQPKISKEQAEESKLLFYWTGVPCQNGHLTYNYRSTGYCRQCTLDSANKANYPESNNEVEKLKPRLKADRLKRDLELERLNKEYDYDFE